MPEESEPRSTYEVVRNATGIGWHVRITFPGRGSEVVVAFATEAEAKAWVKAEQDRRGKLKPFDRIP